MRRYALSSYKLVAATFALAIMGFVTGCAGNFVATDSSSYVEAATLSGKVYGGNNPVYGASVGLYEAGYSGYGIGGNSGKPLAVTTTNASGTFSFTQNSGTATPPSSATTNVYQCDSSYPNALIYIIANGGNTTGAGAVTPANSAASFIAVLGPCNTIGTSTVVNMNELTTAATVYAFAQFMNPGTAAGKAQIGTSSSTQGGLGLSNALSTYANLANNSSAGLGNSNITPPAYTGTGTAAGVTVTAYADSPKLITIANILSSCVNNTSSAANNCVDLFANATPPTAAYTSQPSATFGTAVDTIQAVYYLATNPGLIGAAPSTCNATGAAATKSACLFALATATGAPFQTGASTAPSDYSVAINFVSSGNCVNGNYFFAGPYHAAVDSTGNVWFITGAGTADGIGEISPSGKPLTCVGSYVNGRGITIDTSGNVWGSFYGQGTSTYPGNQIEELPYGSSTLINWPISSPTADSTYSMASDAWGNVFYNEFPNGGTLFEFIDPGTNTTPFAPVTALSPYASTSNPYTLGYMQTDSQGRIWTASSSVLDLFGTYHGSASSATGLTLTTTGGSSGTATFTSSSALPTGFVVGSYAQFIGLTGTVGSTFNYGTYQITAITSTSFTVASSATAVTGESESSTGFAYLAGSYVTHANALSATGYGVGIDSSGNVYQGTTCCGTGSAYRELVEWPVPPINNGVQLAGTLGTAVYSTTNFAGTNGIRSVAVDGASNVFFGNEFPNAGSGGVGSIAATGCTGYTVGSVTVTIAAPPSGLTATATGSATSATAVTITITSGGTGYTSAPTVTLSGGGGTCTAVTATLGQITTGNWSVTEANATSGSWVALSPTGTVPPSTCSTTAGCATGGGFFDINANTTNTSNANYSASPLDMEVDPSGNLWVMNTGNTANTTQGLTVTEYVGIAVPVVTPLSVAAKNKQLGTKP